MSSYNVPFYVVSYKLLYYTIQFIRFRITFLFMWFRIKAITVQAAASAQADEEEEEQEELVEGEEEEDDDDVYEDDDEEEEQEEVVEEEEEEDDDDVYEDDVRWNKFLIGSFELMIVSWSSLCAVLSMAAILSSVPSVIIISERLVLFSEDALIRCLIWLFIDSTGDVVMATYELWMFFRI